MYDSAHIKAAMLFVFCICCTSISAAQNTLFNANCQTAYNNLMRLQLNKGRELAALERTQNAQNPLPILLENYADVLHLFVSEDAAELSRFEAMKDKRLQLLEKCDKKSPFYRYAQAEIQIQWALVHAKFEQYFAAFWEARRAYQLLDQNRQQFPTFYPNLKTIGTIHALVGTLPDRFKWGVRVLGLNGNVKQGMGELKTFLNASKADGQMFYNEGLLIYAFLLNYVNNQPNESWNAIAKLPTNDNLLHTFVLADMAFRAGNNDKAIQLLEQAPQSNDFESFAYLDFLLGTYKLNRLDKDANIHLQHFLQHYKGKNYVKDAHQRLAWCALLQNNLLSYQQYMHQCLNKGTQLIDADRQAHRNAQEGKTPHLALLKARLLFDGGYYAKALQMLNTTLPKELKTTEQQLEYDYRYGRIYQQMNDNPQAILCYQRVINKDTEIQTDFAPKACLQMAKIYETTKQLQQAVKYYQKCLNYKKHDYKNSIDQQAKAGLNRLGY